MSSARVKIVVDDLDAEICHLFGRFGESGFVYLCSPRVDSLKFMFGLDVERSVVARAPESTWVEVRAEVEQEVEHAT